MRKLLSNYKYSKLKKKKVKRKKNKPKINKWKKKYKKYLLSKEWNDIKIDLFEFRGKKCERCGSTNQIQVHHLTYKNVFNEEPEDLEILCKVCHKEEHNIK